MINNVDEDITISKLRTFMQIESFSLQSSSFKIRNIAIIILPIWF